jgi:cell shape-determining protein MreC
MVRGQPTLSRTQRRAWRIALAAALVLSFAPSRWLLGWTSDVAGVAMFPLVPLQHAAALVRHWLRPIPDPRAADPELVQVLERQLEQSRSMRKALELEREELLRRIALLERSLMGSGERRSRGIFATVLSSRPPTSRSPGSLTLNVGTRNGVVPGMVALWDGDVIVGRGAEDPGRLTSLLVPVSGLSGFEVRFEPPDRELPMAQAPGGVVRATPEGIWTVDLTNPGEVGEGWIARLADARWPTAAWGRRLGIVRRVGTRDDAPLVRRLEVHPLVDPFRVPHVVLVDDASAEEEAGSR